MKNKAEVGGRSTEKVTSGWDSRYRWPGSRCSRSSPSPAESPPVGHASLGAPCPQIGRFAPGHYCLQGDNTTSRGRQNALLENDVCSITHTISIILKIMILSLCCTFHNYIEL